MIRRKITSDIYISNRERFKINFVYFWSCSLNVLNPVCSRLLGNWDMEQYIRNKKNLCRIFRFVYLLKLRIYVNYIAELRYNTSIASLRKLDSIKRIENNSHRNR